MREVTLYGAKAAGRVALVDDGDYDLVMQRRWNLYHQIDRRTGPYAFAKLPRVNGRQPAVFMHVLIMGYRGIDHRDGNGLNNCRSNLREATNAQNMGNRRKGAGFSSQYKGVSWDRDSRRWRTKIRTDGKQIHLGMFTDEIEAARAYDVAALRYFGEFAKPNFGPDGLFGDIIPAGAVLLDQKATAA